MRKVKINSSKSELLLVTLIAALIFSPTLWLLESTVKYPLYLFEIALLILLFIHIKSKTKWEADFRELNQGINLALNVTLVFLSAILLFRNIFEFEGGLMQLILAMAVTTFLSGYALLNLLGIREHLSRLELFVISYIISFAISGFILCILLPISSSTRPIVASTIYLSLGALSIIKGIKTSNKARMPTVRGSFSKATDIPLLLMIILLHLIVFFSLYPGLTLRPGSDIPRIYTSMHQFIRAPHFFVKEGLYILYKACLYSLSSYPQYALFESSLGLLNIMSPLAFYIMAKEYLKDIDPRLPSLSTICWSMFSNFGWLYAAKLKLESSAGSQLQMLKQVADKTYLGTVYGASGVAQEAGTWNLAITVSFIMLFISLFLLKQIKMPRSKYFALFSTLTVAMYLTHIIEAVMLTSFLALYGIFSKGKSVRLDDSLKSSLLGFIMISATFAVLMLFAPGFVDVLEPPVMATYLLPLVALILSLAVRRYGKSVSISFHGKSWFQWKHLGTFFVAILVFIYVLCLLVWGSSIDSFSTSQFLEVAVVPYFLYPIILGLAALLMLFALPWIFSDKKLRSNLFFLIAFFAFTFATGRIASIVNVSFFPTGYSEWRLLSLLRLVTCIIAPIPILKISAHLLNRNSLKNLMAVLMLGMMIFYGAQSYFLSLEYLKMTNETQGYLPDSMELEALNQLTQVFDKDPRSRLITISPRSSRNALLSAPQDRLVITQPLYMSNGPEVPLYLLSGTPDSLHAYIYMHYRDFDYMQRYSDKYLAKHLFPILPVIFKNSEVVVYNASALAPPLPSSKSVLAFPLDEFTTEEFREELLFPYDMLSQGLYNYTVAYDFDDKLFGTEILILPLDPPIGNVVTRSFHDDFDSLSNAWSILGGNWRVQEGKLVGGKEKEEGGGRILSQVSAQNFETCFKVSLIDADLSVLNYISFIYSYKDVNNYRFVYVKFSTSGYLYVTLVFVENGVGRWIDWYNTGIKWSLSDEYDVAVVVNGTLNEVFINDEKYLSIKAENIDGRLGLEYLGPCSIAFRDFDVKKYTELKLRSYDEYINFMTSGGKLIILNTNGFNVFARDLLLFSNRTFTAETIQGINGNLELPAGVDVSVTYTKSSDIEPLAYYASPSSEALSIFAARRRVNEGQLFYVNVYPIIRQMRSEADKQSAFYSILGKLLAIAGANLMKVNRTNVLKSEAFFKEAYLEGEIIVKSLSVLFPSRVTIQEADILTENEHLTFHNITSLSFANYSKMIIATSKMDIAGGRGLYTVLNTNRITKLKLVGNNNMSLTLVSEDREFKVSAPEEITLTTESPIEIYARTPSINTSGTTWFTEIYLAGSLKQRTPIYGQNLNITGHVGFDIFLSDSYTFTSSFEIKGSYNRDPQVLRYDELSSLPTAAFWSLVLLPVFLGMTIIIRRKRWH